MPRHAAPEKPLSERQAKRLNSQIVEAALAAVEAPAEGHIPSARESLIADRYHFLRDTTQQFTSQEPLPNWLWLFGITKKDAFNALAGMVLADEAWDSMLPEGRLAGLTTLAEGRHHASESMQLEDRHLENREFPALHT